MFPKTLSTHCATKCIASGKKNGASNVKGKRSRKKCKRKLSISYGADDLEEEKAPNDTGNERATCKDNSTTDMALALDVAVPVHMLQDASDVPSEIIHSHGSFHQATYVPAQPIIDSIWRGEFETGNKIYGMFVAHPSNKAISRVHEGARKLPATLHMQKLPRCEVWPQRFQTLPPNDEDIGLYFFPEMDERSLVLFHELLEDLMQHDIALKFVVDSIELLIFSSIQLPKETQRFSGRYYIWGIFRQVTQKKSCDMEQEEKCDACDENGGSEISNPNTPVSESQEKFTKCRVNGAPSYCEDDMLELFPLREENLAIVTRMGSDCELDLDLGLGRSAPRSGKV
ncbi:uncharacterized protein LOC18444373 isoform X2 [Amborella trichopoda]|uniref:AIPP2-like SPOC-like domain-containing protein n=2 Tax=Amborella trichopoda TaxID=13333 RepID=U5D1I7_AMBTC|nr:uncharacterized protein LOC18444373 isoform X2 [Amborella trichopoda]XP_020529391.1 uncharacterized protein LOC18444373 isoform X2 [Amborella trichopoda]XP_020529392.1 uncharacterized protein LOC18444373 isoform X2 [Amborella trichopoda]XP_020529393.1 uncharacterized protein LOC18444373 isoform X2 [Amborella trichopoda]XP_020529394.1 uncharacterized protein LOC18444373 isoform X2 [Amborella trichopoda]XP_020529395.1 uncharacterized protein LOC18444373 isoform X2 [Amborella trichopoda]XP_02|eukprot:XP_020529390.1 uncharacterized protein LOC18444373 isoform X2 [Amborella trichopoda]